MAGIDKTYFKKWEQYLEVKKWVESVGIVTDDYGNRLNPKNYLWEWTKPEFEESIKGQRDRYQKNLENPEYIAEEKKLWGPDWKPTPIDEVGECVLWNTSCVFDIWLIRNCPIEFIQERLREVQYKFSYENIKARTSDYDNYIRKGSKHYRIKDVKYWCQLRDRKIWWWIQVVKEPEGDSFWYDERTRMWYTWQEAHESDKQTNTANFWGPLSKRKISRLIKRWNLPVGTVLRIEGSWEKWVTHEFYIEIKK
ncbi:MAG: hypothetical protein J6I84_04595 [Bacilli bacterium]|nr:hypothetical protein [Bacilli bacterium]